MGTKEESAMLDQTSSMEERQQLAIEPEIANVCPEEHGDRAVIAPDPPAADFGFPQRLSDGRHHGTEDLA